MKWQRWSPASRLIVLHGVHDPLFGGLTPEPVADNLKELAARVKAEKAAGFGGPAAKLGDGRRIQRKVHTLEAKLAQHDKRLAELQDPPVAAPAPCCRAGSPYPAATVGRDRRIPPRL